MENKTTWDNSFSYRKLVWLNIFLFWLDVMLCSISFVVCLFFLLLFSITLVGEAEKRKPYDFSFEVMKPSSPQVASYTSGDKETDIIVNYFAGYIDLPREWKVAQVYADTLNSVFRNISGSINRADSVRKIYNMLSSQSYREFDDILLAKGIDIEKRFTYVPDSIEKEKINRQSLYHIVWQLYFASGSPVLRYRPSSQGFIFTLVEVDAIYDPFKGRLLLVDLYKDCYVKDESWRYYRCYEWDADVFLEEMGHAKQFKERPCSSISRATYGLVNSLGNSILSRLDIFDHHVDTWDEAYQHEYRRHNSFEYEAHYDLGARYKALFAEATESYEDFAY